MGPCNAEVRPEPVEGGGLEGLLEYLSIPYAGVEVDDKSIRGILMRQPHIEQ